MLNGHRTYHPNNAQNTPLDNLIETPQSAEVPIVIRRSILDRGDFENGRYRSASQSTRSSSLFRSTRTQSFGTSLPYVVESNESDLKLKGRQKLNQLQSISESSTELPRKPWLDVDSPTVPDVYPTPQGGRLKNVVASQARLSQRPILTSRTYQDYDHSGHTVATTFPVPSPQPYMGPAANIHDDETLSRDTLISTYEAYGATESIRSNTFSRSGRLAGAPVVTSLQTDITLRQSSDILPKPSLMLYDSDQYGDFPDISNKEIEVAINQNSVPHTFPNDLAEDEVRRRSARHSVYSVSIESDYNGDSSNESDLAKPKRQIISNSADEKGSTCKSRPVPKRWWKRRRSWIIACILFSLLLLGGGIASFFLIAKSRQSKSSDTYVPGGFLMQPTDLVGNAFAMMGTSLASLSVAGPSDGSNTGYINFYQHSSGELRMSVFNNSQWQASQFLTADAHVGTPVAAYQRGSDFKMSVFYFDKNRVLQETRSDQIGSPWTNGTVGQLVQMSDAPSDLTAQYVGNCQGISLGWLVFHTGLQDQARLLYWDGTSDSWTTSGAFPNVKQGAGFTGQNDAEVWRFYYVSSQSTQLKEQVCPDCCNNPRSAGWVAGLTGAQVSSATGGMAITNIGVPRLIYYQDANGTIRELNNTGNYPNEAWSDNNPSAGFIDTASNFSNPGSAGPVGVPVAKAIPNSKISALIGSRGKLQQILLFYQTNNTDIQVQTRDAGTIGQWTDPTPIPVGR